MLDCSTRVYAGRIRKMKFIDMHCDTMTHLMKDKSVHLRQNNSCIDVQKMRKANHMAEFFACFIQKIEFPGDNGWDNAYDYALHMIQHSKKTIENVSDELLLATCYEDILEHDRAGKMSAILTVEEGGILNGNLSRLQELYDLGVRLMTLTWNYENCIGHSNRQKGGLKPFGIKVVEKMNELGMLIDVSHLSDEGFWDVIHYSQRPITASHSNMRSLCNHSRNLTDDMLKALAEKGGVAGINFYPYFLNSQGKATVEHIGAHLYHMYQVGGEDVVAIGTDFDGFDDGELELCDISQIPLVYEKIKQYGFTERQMEKFWYKNVLRVFKDGCGSR